MTINEQHPKTTNDACPSCGYCPHCGRGGRQAYPFYPQSPPWWTGNDRFQWGGGITTTGTLPGVSGPYFVTGMTARFQGNPDVNPNASWTQE